MLWHFEKNTELRLGREGKFSGTIIKSTFVRRLLTGKGVDCDFLHSDFRYSTLETLLARRL